MKTFTTIPTRYAGVIFRSKTEARFAAWCETWSVRWEYEPEGFQIGGVRYLPDFWLPEGKTLVEIKPALFLNEAWKLDALAAALDPSDEVYAWDDDEVHRGITLWCGTMSGEGFEVHRLWKDMGWEGRGDIRATWCTECGWPHVIGLGRYDCRRCGWWDGDHALGSFLGPQEDHVIPAKRWIKL
jgi:hypothetical protein